MTETPPRIQLVQRNRKAGYNYEISERYEAGLVLKGSEVKSIRNGQASIAEAYARVQNGQVWIVGMDIALYPQAGPHHNHEPRRPRKLLLHRHEIRKLAGQTRERGLTLVPLALYFKDGKAKLEIGLARGKKKFDKRHSIKAREADREVRRRTLHR